MAELVTADRDAPSAVLHNLAATAAVHALGVNNFLAHAVLAPEALPHRFVFFQCDWLGVPEEIAIQLVGHANAKMIHEVYMALKPQMLEDARKRLDALL